jgi:hypothetical protein
MGIITGEHKGHGRKGPWPISRYCYQYSSGYTGKYGAYLIENISPQAMMLLIFEREALLMHSALEKREIP